jgi:hypothetical protein
MKIQEVNSARQLLRCPRCNELIGAVSQECRYCHRILNTTEIRAGIERYERVQQEESARKDRRALWFSICALLGSIALFALELAHQFVNEFVDLPKISHANGAVLAITMFLLIGFLKRTLDKMKP